MQKKAKSLLTKLFDHYTNSSTNNSTVTEYQHVNYYEKARDAYLSERLSEYPNIDSFDMSINFSISPSAKNGVIVHAILDTMPSDSYVIEKNNVSINPKNSQLGICLQAIADILSIVKSWKSTIIRCNGAVIDYTGFYYFLDFYETRNNLKKTQRNSIQVLKSAYISKPNTQHHRRKAQPLTLPPVYISRENIELAVDNAITRYIELFSRNNEIVIKQIPRKGKVVIIENSLIVYFWASPRYWAARNSSNQRDWEHPYIMIQELTHNDLFKFNFSRFKSNFICDNIGISFFAFHGLNHYDKAIDHFNLVNRVFPELELIKRFEQYPGKKHHFIILRIEDRNGKTHYGVGVTQKSVHTFVLKLCAELEQRNSHSPELSCLSYSENRDFISAFLSWKGKSKLWRLENKFSYSYVDIMVKNDSVIKQISSQIIEKANNGEYSHLEYGTYSKPANRWKSEELAYNITRKLYRDYQVIYQYSPYYLSTDKGCMSYDIYICGLKVAIEYQGKQHFEPVDYFGGKESFKKQQERDKLKAKRSKENGVSLIYINYWDDITPSLIKQRVEEAIRIPSTI